MRRARRFAGRMRQSFTIERLGAMSGAYVSGSESWSTLVTFRGQLRTRRGPGVGEVELADAMRTVNMVEIHAHYSAALAGAREADRLVDSRTGDVYDIRHIDNVDGLNRLIVITAEKGRPNG